MTGPQGPFDGGARSESLVLGDPFKSTAHCIGGRWVEDAGNFTRNLAECWNRRAGTGKFAARDLDQREAESFRRSLGAKNALALLEQVP